MSPLKIGQSRAQMHKTIEITLADPVFDPQPHLIIDPARVELGRTSVGGASWLIPFANIFGDA